MFCTPIPGSQEVVGNCLNPALAKNRPKLIPSRVRSKGQAQWAVSLDRFLELFLNHHKTLADRSKLLGPLLGINKHQTDSTLVISVATRFRDVTPEICECQVSQPPRPDIGAFATTGTGYEVAKKRPQVQIIRGWPASRRTVQKTHFHTEDRP